MKMVKGTLEMRMDAIRSSTGVFASLLEGGARAFNNIRDPSDFLLRNLDSFYLRVQGLYRRIVEYPTVVEGTVEPFREYLNGLELLKANLEADILLGKINPEKLKLYSDAFRILRDEVPEAYYVTYQ